MAAGRCIAFGRSRARDSARPAQPQDARLVALRGGGSAPFRFAQVTGPVRAFPLLRGLAKAPTRQKAPPGGTGRRR